MASSITSFSEPQDRSQDKNARTEAGINIDRFATLFSPATPRPSPTLDPVTLDSGPMPYHRPRSFHHDRRDTGSDAESGAFVSVSSTEDPLSALDFALSPSIEASSSPLDANDKDRRKNSSLRFFGKFTQEAAEAAERNKRGVLDELLLHEDDPLYWLKDEQSASGSDELPRPPSLPATYPEADASVSAKPDEGPETDTGFNSLLDLDHDFFASKTIENPPSSSSHTHASPSTVHHSPSRSPTQPTAVTLALPVAMASTASSTPAGETSDPLSHNTAPEELTARRSNSYHTLSSRWMSSLLSPKLSSANSPPPDASSSNGHPAPPSLETLFNTEASSTVNRKPRSRSSPTTARYASTLPRTSDVQISHGTPFGHHSRSSPFAPHLYTPPSGAPGYAGERYDWDRGFSTDLRLEMERDKDQDGEDVGERGRQEREMTHVGRDGSGSRSGGRSRQGMMASGGNGKELADGHVHVVRVGEFMEKRSGHVQLEGRKAMTTPVLDVKLADAIRHHLPALARLPRKWTLLYSLDQHGISLNTLYARCEFSPPGIGKPSPRGSLLVLKDAGDALFGVWMGENGLHPSRGKGYYGSGDSFLWKYVDEKFEVFKWTGRNDYVALCEPDYISFGGGDGQYGLYLDESLLDGSSARCLTFGNDPLCTPEPKTVGTVKFECVGLEVWGIGP